MLRAKNPLLLQRWLSTLGFHRPLARTITAVKPAAVELELPTSSSSSTDSTDLLEPSLRSYQAEALKETLKGWREGTARRQLISMATGAGKTVTFCALIKALQRRTLILVNRKELVAQTVKTLSKVGVSSADVGIVHNRRKQYDRRIVVATIQSACQTVLPLLAEQDFELLIIDEAHHGIASTYLTVMVHTGFLSAAEAQDVAQASKSLPAFARGTSGTPADQDHISDGDDSSDGDEAVSSSSSVPVSTAEQSAEGTQDAAADETGTAREVQALCGGAISRSEKLVLGVTATPYRNDDRRALAVVFQREAYSVSISQLISEGHLCKVKAHRILTWTDISKVPVKSTLSEKDEDGSADYKAAELSKAVNTDSRNKLVVESFKARGKGRKAVAFCCDIAHATALAAMFRTLGVRAECVTSLSGKDRDRLLEEHKAGEIEVLTNVGILTEGYDDPSISCIIMARPTKSTGLYTQCVGRGLRTCEGKEDCLILDFTDRSHRLDKASDLITCEYLLQNVEGVELVGYLPPSPAERVAPEIKSMLEGGAMTLFDDSQLAWTALNNDLWLNLYYSGKPFAGRSISRSAAPAQTVWVHLMCEGHMTVKRKDHLVYRLRVAKVKDMPPLDSPSWVVIDNTHKDSEDGEFRFKLPELSPAASKSQDRTSVLNEPEPLLSSAMLQRVELHLLRHLRSNLDPVVWNSMLRLVQRQADWCHKDVSDAQLDKIRREFKNWGVFESVNDIPRHLNRGQASMLINFGVLYEAYRKANPEEEEHATQQNAAITSLRRNWQ